MWLLGPSRNVVPPSPHTATSFLPTGLNVLPCREGAAPATRPGGRAPRRCDEGSRCHLLALISLETLDSFIFSPFYLPLSRGAPRSRPRLKGVTLCTLCRVSSQDAPVTKCRSEGRKERGWRIATCPLSGPPRLVPAGRPGARCLPASSPGWPGRDTQRVREEGWRSRPTSGSPVISLRRRLHGFPRENKKCLAPGSPHPTHELFRSQTQRIACRAPRVCARRTADSHPRRPSGSLSARLLRDPYRSTYPRMYCIRLDSHVFSIKSDTTRLFCTWLLRIILSLCKIAKCLIMDLDFLRNQCDTADKEILSVK